MQGSETSRENILGKFRNAGLAKGLVKEISKLSSGMKRARIMHVCGSHEHTATYYGLRSLLPAEVELIAGPGCPVCVCSTADVREAMELARRGATVCTFGDVLRDRTPYGSLEDAKKEGFDIRVVYSPLDALRLAKSNPSLEVVLFAVGFETTAAPVSSLFCNEVPENFSLLTSLKRTPPVIDVLLHSVGVVFDGIIAPGHVSTIVGALDWKGIADEFELPVVVAGFEPVDMLLVIRDILEQVKEGRHELRNEYKRLARYQGNPRAKELMAQVFEVSDAYWRGIGYVPKSGYFLRRGLRSFDARSKHGVEFEVETEKDFPPGCICCFVIAGLENPTACNLFVEGTCSPEHPVGPCMVSGEGTCYIWKRYGSPELLRWRLAHVPRSTRENR
jgi:hydrogenase expression/formation protein HypD